MPDASVLTLAEGSSFQGRYTIGRCIKVGGMGAVYEVTHIETRRRRALKVMLPSLIRDPDLRARFKLEATVTAEIESHHVVETFDAGIDAETGAPFLVMELLKGEELAELLARKKRLSATEALELLRQCALALDKTHAAGIIHRDLKPENLFVTRRDDGAPHLKVLDFGVAKLFAQSQQSIKTTRSLGTPLYMPPEQIEGAGTIDHRADLYSLAHIAFTMLVGEAYWEPESRATDSVYPVLLKVMKGAPEPASFRAARLEVTLPSAFDAWFAKGTALAPEDRFEGAGELVAALATALGEPLSSRASVAQEVAAPAPPASRGTTTGRRTRLDASMDARQDEEPREDDEPVELPHHRRVGPLVAVLGLGAGAVLAAVVFAGRAGPSPPAGQGPGSAPAASAPPLDTVKPAPVTPPAPPRAAPPEGAGILVAPGETAGPATATTDAGSHALISPRTNPGPRTRASSTARSTAAPAPSDPTDVR
jgi:serine/threonine-protein kinase